MSGDTIHLEIVDTSFHLDVQDTVFHLDLGEIGPVGPAGPPGDGSGGALEHNSLAGLTTGDPHTQYLNPSRAQAAHFSITARFAELDSAQAKADARAALELNIIDCGTF